MVRKVTRTLFTKRFFLIVCIVVVLAVLYILIMRDVPQSSPKIAGESDGQSDIFTSCYVQSASFPPSETEPPLPPPNPRPYLPPNHVCRHFSFEFCDTLELFFPEVKCDMIYFDKHAANLIKYTDSSGQRWVCVVEPQTNEYYCMREEEFNLLSLEEWLREVVCKKYYPSIPDEDCNKFRSGILSYCEEIIGTTCSNRGETAPCYVPSTGEIQVVKCVCKGFFSIECTWKRIPYIFSEATGTSSTSGQN